MSKHRRGRPRKTGPRHATGHLKAPRDSPRAIAAAMPHRRGLGDHAVDPHAETELGRSLLRGEITATQAFAGETYAYLWAGYVATLDAPQALRSGEGHELHCRGCVSDHDRAHCLCAMRKRVYLEAANVLLTTTSRGVTDLVSNVVIHDRQCPFALLNELNMGLSVLAAHFGLTKARNSWHQNAWSEL